MRERLLARGQVEMEHSMHQRATGTYHELIELCRDHSEAKGLWEYHYIKGLNLRISGFTD